MTSNVAVKRVKKQKKHVLLLFFVRIISFCARIFPYRCATAAGTALGALLYRLLPRDRERALTNIKSVFPDKDSSWTANTAKMTFSHLGRALLEILAVRPDTIASLVTIDGLDHLKNALGRGKGVIFVTGHIGNWELMAGAIAQQFSVSVVAAPLKPEPLNDMIVSLRARLGVRTIVRGSRGAAKELIRVFRENRILGILIDQDTDVDGTFVDFMGRPAWTPTAAAQMALRFGAPVIFGYIQREQNLRHRVVIEGPLDLVHTENTDEDIKMNTAMFTKRIESAILQKPEQWVWMHRRWRRQP